MDGIGAAAFDVQFSCKGIGACLPAFGGCAARRADEVAVVSRLTGNFAGANVGLEAVATKEGERGLVAFEVVVEECGGVAAGHHDLEGTGDGAWIGDEVADGRSVGEFAVGTTRDAHPLLGAEGGIVHGGLIGVFGGGVVAAAADDLVGPAVAAQGGDGRRIGLGCGEATHCVDAGIDARHQSRCSATHRVADHTCHGIDFLEKVTPAIGTLKLEIIETSSEFFRKFQMTHLKAILHVGTDDDIAPSGKVAANLGVIQIVEVKTMAKGDDGKYSWPDGRTCAGTDAGVPNVCAHAWCLQGVVCKGDVSLADGKAACGGLCRQIHRYREKRCRYYGSHGDVQGYLIHLDILFKKLIAA